MLNGLLYMSISTGLLDNQPLDDPLTPLLAELGFSAEIYLHSRYCGVWGVDTSGSGRLPFHLISSGRGWLHTPDGECLPLHAGDLVLFPHDSSHVMSDSPTTTAATEFVPAELDADSSEQPVTSMICGFFSLQGADALLANLPAAIVMELSDTSRHPETGLLLQLMIGELDDPKPGNKVVVDQLAKALFVHILRVQMTKGLCSGLLAALFDTRVGKALSLIHSQPEQHWTLDSLAQASHQSRTVLANRFKELVGVTPMRYLAEWRMRLATRLLRAGETTANVAEQVGYASDAAFSKAFKQITGNTPGAIRRNLGV
jgi:AraC family transcriptional activator of mtrCDE